jgi:competence protein ComEC
MIGVGPRTSALVGGVVLTGYLEIAGPRPNVLRAALMAGVGMLALATGRTRATGAVLSASVIVLALWRPDFGADLGFALSVLATGAMLLLSGPLAEALQRRRVPAGIAEVLAIAVVAQLATAPLIAGSFGQISLPSVLANVLAEPAFVPALLVGAVTMACSAVWPWLAGVIAHLAWPATAWLRWVPHWVAGMPATAVAWPTGWLGGLALAALIIAIVIAARLPRMRALLTAVVIALAVVWIPVRVLAPGWPPPAWAMVDCDVGQGDGEVLATSEPGRAVVVDTGPDDTAIGECLDRLDVDRVPLVVLSHLHADHIGGLATVLRDRAVGAVAVGPSRVPAWAWTQVVHETAAARVPLVQLSVGERLRWPGLVVDVIGPPAAQSWPAGDDPSGTVVNNSSLVLRANTSVGRVLLTGDVELAAQADLLASGVDLSADVLKVPHHGSRYSAPSFLDAVHARLAVASVGAGNPYGHPSPLTLNRLAVDGALVLRTDHDGDVAIVRGPTGPAVIRRGDPRAPPHRTTNRRAPTAGG